MRGTFCCKAMKVAIAFYKKENMKMFSSTGVCNFESI